MLLIVELRSFGQRDALRQAGAGRVVVTQQEGLEILAANIAFVLVDLCRDIAVAETCGQVFGRRAGLDSGAGETALIFVFMRHSVTTCQAICPKSVF